jgi:hypothetical protein
MPAFAPNLGGSSAETGGSHPFEHGNIALLVNHMASSFAASSDGYGETSMANPTTVMPEHTPSLINPHT